MIKCEVRLERKRISHLFRKCDMKADGDKNNHSAINSIRLVLQAFAISSARFLQVVIWRSLCWLMRLLFGQFHWQAPEWGVWLAQRSRHGIALIRAYPRYALSALLMLMLLFAGGWYSYQWWKARPRTQEITFTVTEPGRTEIESSDVEQRKPKPLVIDFDHAVAPLAVVGKEVSAGITVNPEVAGIWRWTDDRTLVFTPANDWPIGMDYRVNFERSLFVPEARLADYSATFSTAAFVVEIKSTQFYQDPVNPTVKKAIIELNFTHPVNPVELEKRIELRLEEQSKGVLGLGKETTQYTVTYDKLKLNAYIYSVSLPIPKDGSKLDFTLDKGVSAARGGKPFSNDLKQTIDIPGLYSLTVDAVQPQVVTNDKGEPEQVLILNTSTTVHEREIQKALSIWVLPRSHPDPKQQKPYGTKPYPWRSEQVTDMALKQSQSLPLEFIPAEQEYTQTHSFRYRADVGSYLYVRVGTGVKSFGGYLLGKQVHTVVRVPVFPPELKILSQGALLAVSGEKKVAVLVRDLPGVKVEIGRILPAQLQHLVSQASGNFANPEFYGSFGPDNLTERFEKKVSLPFLTRGRAHYEAIDLAKYLKDGYTERRGVFLLTVSGYAPQKEASNYAYNQGQANEMSVADEPNNNCEDECGSQDENDAAPENQIDKRLILVTDLGIVVKKSLDGSQEIYVQSIYTGKPVEGAMVDIVGKNGLTLFSQVTDKSGHTRFAKISGLTRERAPLMVLVRKGSDLSFIPLNRAERGLDVSRFDVGGIRNAVTDDQLSAYLFSDRGIYRPGDTFHIGMIVKPANWLTNTTGLPLELEIVDARGLAVKREKIKLSAGGFVETSYATQETSPTGNYHVNLYLVKDGYAGAQIGSTSVKVQEFQPDHMRVTARFSEKSNEGWVNPQELKALVNAQNLFGTPAENRRVTAELILSPAFPAFKRYPEYTFYDPQRTKNGYTDKLGERTTDARGDAQFDLGLEKYAKASYRLHFLTRVYEPQGGRGVSAEVATLVSELPYLVGFRADGALSYVSRGSKRNVNVIAINSKTVKTAVNDLTLQWVERKFVSVLTKQNNGSFKYESRKKEITLKETPLAIPTNGYALTLATDTPGNFAYVIRDAQGVEFNRIEYAVAGKGNVTRSLERNSELQLTLSKADYVPGEEIEISIKAPYTGAGLITIERDKVLTHQWFKSDTLASVQKIRLPKDFEGNGYISVQFVRDPSSDEIFMSPLSYGVVPFATNLSARANKLNLNVPELIKPGQILRMKLTSTQPTRAVIFAIDEGILQVARYQMANPLGYFFQKRMLEVQTSQTLDLILPEFKKLLALSAPGGDMEGVLGKYLNPFKRKHDKPVAYWSGIVDVNGMKELSYTVPDYFNGTIKVMAVAVNDRAIGTAQSNTVVRGDFVLSPNIPLAVTPGDEFEVSVGIANNAPNSGKDAPVMIALKTSPHLAVIGSASQTLKISEMHEGVASYRVKASDGGRAMLGSATLTFTASLGKHSAKLSANVSVRPAVPRYAQITAGSFKRAIEVSVGRNMYSEYRSLEAAVSPLPLVLANGLSSYLANFSHLCTEQLVSQAIPALILAKRPEFAKSDSTLPLARNMEDALRLLRMRQNAEGGFGMWDRAIQADEFASVYAIHMLLEARDQGISVPVDMLQKGLDYLHKLAASPASELAELRIRAYAVYLLTRQMEVTTPFLTSIRETLDKRYPKLWQTDLVGAYLAATYQMQKQERQASVLLDKQIDYLLRHNETIANSSYYFYDALIHDAQTLYLLARHFPKRVQALSPEVLATIVKEISGNRFNTLSSAYLILAFDAYASAIHATATGKLSITAIDANQHTQSLILPSNLLPRVSFPANAAKLRFGNDADITSYFTVAQTGFDKEVPKTELRSGIEVLREFVDSNGKPVASVRVGDELTVKLKFRAVGRQNVTNVALIDLMPGGFEAMLDTPNESISVDQTTPQDDGVLDGEQQYQALAGLAGAKASNWKIDYADVREDRIVFYGTVTQDFGEVIYRIRATNSGTFMVPPAYAESMYERNMQARSAAGRSITVLPAAK